MAAEPVRLHDFAESPNGRRYAQEEKDAAFEYWRTVGARSLRATADATGIATSTLGTWHQRDDWPARARQADEQDRKSVGLGIRALVNAQTLKSIETAVKLRDDEKVPPKVRLDAAIWISGVGGVAPIKATMDLTRPPADDFVAQDWDEEKIRALSPEERDQLRRGILPGARSA